MMKMAFSPILMISPPSFCRSIHLAYVEDVEVKGIQAYRFAPPNDVLMSPKDNPTNEGFCVPKGDCLGTGVLKVSVCREGTSASLLQIDLTPFSYLRD